MISWTHIYPTPDLSRPHIQRETGDRFNDVGCLSQLSVVVKLMVAINVPPWDNPTTRVPSNNKCGSSMTKAVGFLASLFPPPTRHPFAQPTPQPPDLPSLFFLSLRRSSVLIFDICPWRRPTSEGETPLRRSEGVVKKNTAAMTVNNNMMRSKQHLRLKFWVRQWTITSLNILRLGVIKSSGQSQMWIFLPGVISPSPNPLLVIRGVWPGLLCCRWLLTR